MSDMRLIVAGAAGRMGCAIIDLIAKTPGVALAAALGGPNSAALGQDAGIYAGCGHLGVEISSDPLTAALEADGIIDFSSPHLSVELAALAAQARMSISLARPVFPPRITKRSRRRAIMRRSCNPAI